MLRARALTLSSTAIDAARFGFHVSNSEAVNSAALRAAVVFANGRPVTVQVPTDCVMGSVDLSNMHVNLEFVGNGWIALNGTIRVSGHYEEIQSVSSITVAAFNANAARGIGNSSGTTTLTLSGVTGSVRTGETVTGTGVPGSTTIVSQVSGVTRGDGVYLTNNATTCVGASLVIGGNSTLCTAFAAEDGTVYDRDDVMRLVSDDYDPASRRANGRYGEDFTVLETLDDNVYMAGTPEYLGAPAYAPNVPYDPDAPLPPNTEAYTNNVRIGRLVKYNVRIVNLNLEGVIPTAGLITVGPHFQPYVQMKFRNALRWAFMARGCIEGEFHVKGSFPQTGNFDDLLYGVEPLSSARCRFPNLEIFGGRHAYTTGFSDVDEGSDDLFDYGRPRDNVVTNGVSTSCSNAPWDDHEGGLRSTFIRCISRDAQRGGGVKKSAYQARGIDMQIIESITDHTFACLLMNGVQTPEESTTIIQGGITGSAPLGAHDSNPANDVIPRGAVYIKGLVTKITSIKTDNSTPFQVINHPLTVDGGIFELYQTADNRGVFGGIAAYITIKGDPMFKCSGVINGWRFASLATGSRLIGDFQFDNSGHTYSGTVRLFRSRDTDCSFNVKYTQTAGTAVGPVLSSGGSPETWVESAWIKWDDTTPPRVITP